MCFFKKTKDNDFCCAVDGKMHQQKCCQAAIAAVSIKFSFIFEFLFSLLDFKHFSSGAEIVNKVLKIKEEGNLMRVTNSEHTLNEEPGL